MCIVISNCDAITFNTLFEFFVLKLHVPVVLRSVMSRGVPAKKGTGVVTAASVN